jgi:hypothetical protein
MEQLNPVYISKEKAAKKLGLGPRRVLELAKQGMLGKQRVWSEKTHRHQILIAESDVEQYLRRQQENAETGGISPAKNGAIAQETALIRMSDVITKIRGDLPLPPPGPKYKEWQWLTLEEAAAELRLPAQAVVQAILTNELVDAFRLRRTKGAGWYIRFSALKSFKVGKPVPQMLWPAGSPWGWI